MSRLSTHREGTWRSEAVKGFCVLTKLIVAAACFLPLMSCDIPRERAERDEANEGSHAPPDAGEVTREQPDTREPPDMDPGAIQRSPKDSPGLIFVAYRNLRGGADGVALIDLDPESGHFGKIIQRRNIARGVIPHHLYFNRDQSRLYSTALSGSNLYEIMLDRGADGLPRMAQVKEVDTGGNLVGEDMYFTEDGSRFYMTFMGGDGSVTGGSVGVFDAHSNELIEIVSARVPADPSSGAPFIMYPHGISANEELGILMITSTIHADLSTGVGNTVTAIDLETNELLETYLVADSWDDLSSPVEVILLRDELPRYALVNTMLGGDIWIAAYDEECERFESFDKILEGEDSGLSWPLEFYIHESHEGEHELYVSFASPGVINVYSLDELPALPLKRTLPADAGAHHMSFFETESGREVVAVQNNLLAIDGLDAGTLMVVDIHTGEVLGTLDLAGEHGMLPESIESAHGHGHDYHH